MLYLNELLFTLYGHDHGRWMSTNALQSLEKISLRMISCYQFFALCRHGNNRDTERPRSWHASKHPEIDQGMPSSTEKVSVT